MEIPESVKSDIKNYVRVDDGLKEAHSQMKGTKEEMKECAERIITFMRQSKMDKFSLKKGEQSLILQEKTLKIRPVAEAIHARLAEMLAEGKTDPSYIWDEIQKCGGTKTVWKLARRSKRKSDSKKRPRPDTDTDEE
jgi:hypothetical protein